ncbi:uroporphyrin-III C-methyltransferase [Saitoella coloradoensis]
MTIPLLTSTNCTGHVHLLVGSTPLVASRATKVLDAGAIPVLITETATKELPYDLLKRVEEGVVRHIQRSWEESDLSTLGREEVGRWVDTVFCALPPTGESAQKLSMVCKRNRVPINVADSPSLSTFTLLSTHTDLPLQIGVTTSGRGCHLASRIRREIVSSLPKELPAAIERISTLRERLWHASSTPSATPPLSEDDIDPSTQMNELVTAAPTDEDADQEKAKTRRARWLAQICEYWPLERIAALTDAELDGMLASYTSNPSSSVSTTPGTDEVTGKKKGSIHLIGSGPGSPGLLTVAAHEAIKTATLILADKLVPAPVLALIPRRTPIHIARKFPGNAELAQQELLDMGLAALHRGEKVVRLKQGDPYLYGRGGEEVIFFREHGWECTVVPGVTSALSGPLLAGIPPTHRGVADEILVCTGTGRKGEPPVPPPYVKSRTTVFLMAIHRLDALVSSLVSPPPGSLTAAAPWPAELPCAVIERASSRDQRVVRTRLGDVVRAMESVGGRPPGLIVVGWACEVLAKTGVPEGGWVVEEGVNLGEYEGLIGGEAKVEREA